MDDSKLCFIRVVEAGSFRQAAKQLKVEASTVSRKVASLEQRLNVQLLNRSSQRSTPTELGAEYYERLKALMLEQNALDDDISQGVSHVKGTIHITAPVDFGAQFVVPVCQKLQQQFPNLSVELRLGSDFRELSTANLDVAVRIGQLPDSNLIAQKVGDVARVLVASPEYLVRSGFPKTPNDLLEHQFVFYSSDQRKKLIRFSDGSQIPYKQLTAPFTVNSVTAIRQLVIAGKGVHLGPYWFFKEAIAQGLVEPLLTDHPLESYPVQCVYTSRHYLPIKVGEFIKLMSAYLAEHLS